MENQDQQWKEVNQGVWKPEQNGDSITGVLLEKHPEDKTNDISARYILEKDDGVFLVWGSAVLDSRMVAVNIGDKVRITFKEKRDIGKNKTLNIYKVEVARPTKVIV